MALIKLETIINAPIETCFNLSRDIDLHQQSMKHAREKAIAGTTTRLRYRWSYLLIKLYSAALRKRPAVLLALNFE